MPRYYFDLRMGEQIVADEIGVELPDLDAARSDAIETAHEMISESLLQGCPIELQQEFEIADGARKLLMTVRFFDVVDIPPDLGQTANTVAEEEGDQPSKNWYAWYAANQARLADAAKARSR